MKIEHLAVGLAAAAATAVPASAAPTIAQLRGAHRILIVSGAPGSAELVAQRRVLADWRSHGQERDVASVILEGSKVEGASDAAAAIRKRYAVPSAGFAVALVGKDGRVAFRSSSPVTGEEFDRTIDAMPMRRAGQR